MKKIIIALLFFTALPLFGQSALYKKSFMGYRDCYWGQNITEIQLDKQIHFVKNHLTEPARIMGQQSAFNYYFDSRNRLQAIAYTIDYSEETLEKLAAKINESYKDVKITYSDFFNKLLIEAENAEERKSEIKKIINENSFEYLILDDVLGYVNGGDSTTEDVFRDSSKEKTNTGLIQAKVNAGTQLFITFNWFFENKIVAVYCATPEDNF